jgi:hypothetical protein
MPFFSTSGVYQASLQFCFTAQRISIFKSGLYMFFLCGLAVSASHTRLREGLGTTRLQPLTARAKKGLISGAACMFVMVPLIAWFNIGTIKSESLLNYALDLWTIDNPSAKQIEETARIGEKAAKYNPLDFFSSGFFQCLAGRKNSQSNGRYE